MSATAPNYDAYESLPDWPKKPFGIIDPTNGPLLYPGPVDNAETHDEYW
jgi:hypothetical protein